MQKWVFCVRGVNFAKIIVHSVREWRTPCSKTSVKHRGHFRILKEGTSKNHTFGGSRTGGNTQRWAAYNEICLGGSRGKP